MWLSFYFFIVWSNKIDNLCIDLKGFVSVWGRVCGDENRLTLCKDRKNRTLFKMLLNFNYAGIRNSFVRFLWDLFVRDSSGNRLYRCGYHDYQEKAACLSVSVRYKELTMRL